MATARLIALVSIFLAMRTKIALLSTDCNSIARRQRVGKSIALLSMKKAPAKSQESLALKAAWLASGLKKAAVADHMGVTPGAALQWIEGHRPVPATKAKRLGELLNVAPDRICAKFAEISEQHSSNVVPLRRDDGTDQRRPDLALRRVENDVDALRYALAGVVAVTVIHRPAEAVAVAAAIRRSVPKKFQERGFVQELLITLDAAAKA